jgi:hypothetical protein
MPYSATFRSSDEIIASAIVSRNGRARFAVGTM